jgi:transcriptional regulator with XRE-family HTH domain
MNNMSQEICIGERIREIFNKRHISVAQFAALLHCDHANVYNIFRRKKIDIELLLQISKILNHNFVEEICLKHEFIQNMPSAKISLVLEIKNMDAQTAETFLNVLKQLEIKTIQEIED